MTAAKLSIVAEPSQSTKTTCPYCGVGCGVVVTPMEDGTVKVQGDPNHPANFGRLCSKGSSLGETLSLDDRLLYPEIRGERCDWDTALDTVADTFRSVIDEHGPDAVAMYVSGQILTEDYYVANKLMKGFIGTANIDTNSRLCMSTAVVGHKRAFGTDTVPACYDDLEQADLLIFTGSNFAWAHPVLFQRVMMAKKARPAMKIVVIDPRRTATCEIADLHLRLRPGSDATLFNGLLNYLVKQNALNTRFIERYTEGFEKALIAVMGHSPESVAADCDLPLQDLMTLFDWFAQTPKTVTVFSQGINQSSSGVDKANAIINTHLATGRIGQPGSAPFSITGQPNAMGGREVGGLANQLAAHMDFDDKSLDTVQRFWNSSVIAAQAGLKAVDLFQAVADGKIKALWIMSTNPVVSVPEADKVRAALQSCEFVVVSDCTAKTDTTLCADVLLPAATWGEKDGTVTNSERCISHQKAFLRLPGEAKPDWWAIVEVARRLGFADAFNYASQSDIFREHAALSGFENAGSRDFDISACESVSDADYHNLTPFQWPLPAGQQSGTARMFADGRFFTPSRKARFVPVSPRLPAIATDENFPLVFNTGRIRDQWHTMTRTAKTPRLMGHLPEPYIEVHPQDARRYGLTEGALAEVYNHNASLIMRVQLSESVRPGSLFAPMHWTGQYASAARVDALVNAITDPISGQPESKHAPVAVKPYASSWNGFILTRTEPLSLPGGYWAKVREKHCWRIIAEGQHTPENWQADIHQWLGDHGDWIEMQDSRYGGYRAARLIDGRLDTLVVVAASGCDMKPAWLLEQFAAETLDADSRRTLLSGRPAAPIKDIGRIVCSCFSVGMNTIVEAISEQQLLSVEAIGQALKAGSNCGSCKPELAVILQQQTALQRKAG